MKYHTKITTAALLAVALQLTASADIAETFTTANQTPFDGTAELTWVGDVGSMEITSTQLQHTVTDVTARVVLTDMGTGYAPGRTWSGRVRSTATMIVNSSQFGGLILASDSTNAANVLAGTINGFRLVWQGTATTDYLRLQQASGSAWSTVSEVSVAAGLNFNVNPVFTASVDASGNFSYSDGVNSGTYAAGAVTLGSYAGFIVADNGSTRAMAMDDFSVKALVPPTAPAAVNDAYDVVKNTTFNLAAPGVLANDTDANGDPMTATLVSSTTNGTLSFSNNGSFSYQPNTSFTGVDSFTYTATDGALTGNVAAVTLNVGTPLALAHILQSNMVLQRGQPIPVWGWGPPGATVSVNLSSGQAANAVVNAEGRWEVSLTAMAATYGPLTLAVSSPGLSPITLTNLAVGDVIFCSGQSNAGWGLDQTDGGEAEAATANYPGFRLIRVPRYKLDAPSEDPIVPENTLDWDPATGALQAKSGKWFVCSPTTAGDFGAVFYYAGKELHQTLGIPVGIIQSAYAGTPVEAWAKSDVPQSHLPGDDPADPHQLFNGMVHPYLRMPVTGFCWYQGERNTDDGGHIYADKLSIMINDWRTAWNRGALPFYYIQIPPVLEWVDPLYADPLMPYFWEAQTLVESEVANAYMVVVADTTNGGLHSRQKRPVGERMGRRILKNTYGYSTIRDQGPVFTHAVQEGNKLRLHFDQVGGGLAINTNIGYNADGDEAIDINETLLGEDYDKDGVIEGYGEDLNQNGILNPGEDLDGDGIWDKSEWDINFPYLTWFEVCDAQGNFTNATAVISGNTVLVSAPSVPNPVGFRYAWSRFAQGNLKNVDGLPARLCRQTPPFAKNDSYSTIAGRTLSVDLGGILANDQNASTLLPLQHPVLTANPAHGALTVRSDGAFIYTPNAGFSGTDSFTYAVADGLETSAPGTIQIAVLPPGSETGSITREIWYDIPGATTDDLVNDPDYPNSPNEVGTLIRFDSPRDMTAGSGQRIHGYLHPPSTGNYTFWITSSARSKLFLSTDDNPTNAIMISECPVSLSGDYQNWTADARQQSAPIALTGGQRYYIIVLHNEGSADHCSVAWNLGGTTNIIEGAYLSPIAPAVPDIKTYAGWSAWFGVAGTDYLLDFAFNLDPTISNRPITIPTTGTSGLPYWEIAPADRLAVEYLRRKNAPGLSYKVQFTSDLSSGWGDAVNAGAVVPVNDLWERVTVTDHVNVADAPKRFGRVKVIQQD